MRSQLSLKPETYPESMDVDVAGISGKVWEGRIITGAGGGCPVGLHSSHLSRGWNGLSPIVRWDDRSAEVSRGQSKPGFFDWDEGLNINLQGISPGFRWSERCRYIEDENTSTGKLQEVRDRIPGLLVAVGASKSTASQNNLSRRGTSVNGGGAEQGKHDH